MDYPYSLSAEVFTTKQLFLYSEKLRPYTRTSAPHWHRSIDEIIYVLTGSLIAVEGDEERELIAGDFVFFEANSNKLHFLENRSDKDAEFLIFRRQIAKKDAVF